MAWTEFIRYTTISAVEINDNFSLYAEGDKLPRNGSSMDTTDSTLNLGSITYNWNTLYTNEINIKEELGSVINLMAEVTLSATASEIEFTGLNGNEDDFYIILASFLTDKTGSSCRLVINQDSGTNYLGQYIIGTHTTLSVTALRQTESSIYVGYNNRGFTYGSMFSEIFLNVNSNYPRTIQLKSSGEMNSSKCIFTYQSHVWGNASDTITTLTFYGDVANMFCAGTNIQIWGRA